MRPRWTLRCLTRFGDSIRGPPLRRKPPEQLRRKPPEQLRRKPPEQLRRKPRLRLRFRRVATPAGRQVYRLRARPGLLVRLAQLEPVPRVRPASVAAGVELLPGGHPVARGGGPRAGDGRGSRGSRGPPR